MDYATIRDLRQASEVKIPYQIIFSLSKLENIYEMRLFGWVMAKAQAVVKNYDYNLGDINLEYGLDMVRVTIPSRYLLAPEDNVTNVKKAFALANKSIDITLEDGSVMQLNIIAFPRYFKKGIRTYVQFVIDNELWRAMIAFNKGYRIFSMPTYLTLRSPYSVIALLMVSQQTEPITMGYETLRKYFGARHKKAYDRSSNFCARILDSARHELDMRSAWSFTYERHKGGRSGKCEEITLMPYRNTAYYIDNDDQQRIDSISQELQKMPIRLHENVTDYLMHHFGFEAGEVQMIEPYLERLGSWEDQVDILEKTRHRILRRRVANPKGYIVAALKQMM